jgi:hypothetical protein
MALSRGFDAALRSRVAHAAFISRGTNPKPARCRFSLQAAACVSVPDKSMDTANFNYYSAPGNKGTRDASDAGDAILRAKARELIKDRKVPDRLPDRSWGGPGTGAPCMVCGAAVSHEETGLELEFTCDDTAEPSGEQFHVRCFWALEFELGKLELARRAMASSDPGLSTTPSPSADGQAGA